MIRSVIEIIIIIIIIIITTNIYITLILSQDDTSFIARPTYF